MLRRAGKQMPKNTEHQNQLRALLLQQPVRTKHSRKRIAWTALASVTSVFLLFAVIRTGIYSQQTQVANPMGNGGCETCVSSASTGLASGSLYDTLESSLTRQRGNTPTFDPGTRREGFERYGNLLKENSSIGLMSSDEEIDTTILSLFSSMGGSITSLNDYQDAGRWNMQGEIPTASLSEFRNQLREIVGDKNFSDNFQAASQLNQVLTVDEAIENLQTQIDELTAQIQSEKNETKRAQLVQQRDIHAYGITAHEEQKLTLVNETHLATISINTQYIRPWWQATNYYELEKSITGLGQKTFGQSIWINVLFVLRALIVVFSYTFWFVIPIIIWRTWNKIRWEKLERYL